MTAEVAALNFADAIIMHTDKMKTLLQNQGVKAPMLPISLFPYLTNDDYADEYRCVELRNTIAFAGNLKKSGFIEPLLHRDFRNISMVYLLILILRNIMVKSMLEVSNLIMCLL